MVTLMGGVLLWIYLIIDDYFFNEMQFTHLQNTTLSFSKNVSFCIVASTAVCDLCDRNYEVNIMEQYFDMLECSQ